MNPGYPYTFEYPVYARIAKDSSYFDEGPKILIGSILISLLSMEKFLSVIKISVALLFIK